jgi:hypothetical protein
VKSEIWFLSERRRLKTKFCDELSRNELSV